ncbi:unnamed protein product, partial [Timema podura]|nr:unnamed protein product [Timema podura]
MDSDELVSLNTTVINDNTTGVAIIGTDDGNTTSILVACNQGKVMEQPSVELVNNTRLVSILVTEPNITNRRTPADCVVLLFYARFCPFSSMAAPHFNALPRAFPRIQMAAVDAMKHH